LQSGRKGYRVLPGEGVRICQEVARGKKEVRGGTRNLFPEDHFHAIARKKIQVERKGD